MGNRHIKAAVRHELYAKSANRCEFRGCTCHLFEGSKLSKVNNGEICHIEGLNPTSARYNARSTDEERNSVDNLILLCSNHHDLVDQNEHLYTADVLRKMKLDHEKFIEQMLNGQKQSDFQMELQRIFQECCFDQILLEQSFDTPFPEWYIFKLEEGYLRIRELLNEPCSLGISPDVRRDLYAFTQAADYMLSGVAIGCISNGGGIAVPRYHPQDLEAVLANLKSVQETYLRYRFGADNT